VLTLLIDGRLTEVATWPSATPRLVIGAGLDNVMRGRDTPPGDTSA
jgi:hypothetical protein